MARESAECFVYGVNDVGSSDSQFFMVNPSTKDVIKIGQLYKGKNFESLDIDPITGGIYTVTNQENRLYSLSNQGELTAIGIGIGYSGIIGLSFTPDGTLWASNDDSLITISTSGPTAGKGTLVKKIGRKFSDIAWNNDGTILYGLTGNGAIYSYTLATQIVSEIGNINYSAEGMEMRPDGLLMIGLHKPNNVSSIIAYSILSRRIIQDQVINESLEDIEDLGWPERCGIPFSITTATMTITPTMAPIPYMGIKLGNFSTSQTYWHFIENFFKLFFMP